MVKKIVFILLFNVFVLNLFSGYSKFELKEIVNPDGLYVNDNDIYISEGTYVYHYSKKDFKLLNKFGKKGEGPGEFKGRVDFINILPKKLIISSRDKVSYFTKNGNFINEIKSKSPRSSGFISIGKNFIGNSVLMKDKTLFLTINSYNNNLEKINMLFKKESGYQREGKIKIFYSAFDFQANIKNVFVVGRNEFIIDVYGLNGKKLPQIKLNYKNIKIQDRHIKQVYDYFKTNPETKAQFSKIKPKLDFPSFFPAIRSIQVDNELIYIQTYKKIKNKTEVYILDINGKLKKKIIIPIKEPNVLESYPFTIVNKTFYQLVENEETELWNIEILKLDI